MRSATNLLVLICLILFVQDTNCVLEKGGKSRRLDKTSVESDEFGDSRTLQPSMAITDDEEDESKPQKKRKLPRTGPGTAKRRPTTSYSAPVEQCPSPQTTTLSIPCNEDEMTTETVTKKIPITSFRTVTSTTTVWEECPPSRDNTVTVTTRMKMPVRECPSLSCEDACALPQTQRRMTATTTTDEPDDPTPPRIRPSPTRLQSIPRERCTRDRQTIINTQAMTSVIVKGTFSESFVTRFLAWTKYYGLEDGFGSAQDPFPPKEYDDFKGPATYSTTERLNSETMLITTEYKRQKLSGTTYLALHKEETRIHQC